MTASSSSVILVSQMLTRPSVDPERSRLGLSGWNLSCAEVSLGREFGESNRASVTSSLWTSLYCIFAAGLALTSLVGLSQSGTRVRHNSSSNAAFHTKDLSKQHGSRAPCRQQSYA